MRGAVLAVTDWSTASPYGLGRDVHTEGVRAERRTWAVLDPERFPVPEPRTACLVPGFDVREVLGRKGTRAMNRVTGLAVAAVGALAAPEGEGQDTALVLGTTTGSLQSMMDFTRDSLTGDRPFDVDPTMIPNSVMNCAAAQCAIWHRIEGPNTTLAAGRPSGLLGLAYARRLLVNGRARAVLCGAAEEYSGARAWIEHHNGPGPLAVPPPLGEGAAVLRVELADAPGAGRPLATVLALHSRQCLPGTDLTAAIGTVAQQVLQQAEVTVHQVWAAAYSGLCPAENQALEELLGADRLRQLPDTTQLLGDTGAASAAFQLATVLALADRAPGRIVLVTSVDDSGTVAAAVLRLATEPASDRSETGGMR